MYDLEFYSMYLYKIVLDHLQMYYDALDISSIDTHNQDISKGTIKKITQKYEFSR